jgi:hypothetical protein
MRYILFFTIASMMSGRPASKCVTIEYVRWSARSAISPDATTGMPFTSMNFL